LSDFMKQTVQVTINGRVYQEEAEPRLLLSHFLREVAGLTGTHVGCVIGECGACTVLVDGKLVKSCLLFAVQANGREITTIEGLARVGRYPLGEPVRPTPPVGLSANPSHGHGERVPADTSGTLHPIQEAFVERYGFQCGYCTPGMILAAHSLLTENPDPSEDEIRRALAGNLCMCTGYKQIIESVQAAAQKLRQR
jgi:carbon-monoxide dehydrogenase small subunit